MTPTEKDAMALAVFDLVLDGQHTHSEIIEARAHLASRIAELEQSVRLITEDRECYAVMLARDEAELAAVLAFLRDDAAAITYQSLGQYRKAAVDDARGGGDV